MNTPESRLERRAHLALGWGVLVISLLTYLLTLEPTVSYWDCPEYVTSAYGMQAGHPPGNPVWMLVARFFINFAPSREFIPLMVNAMSAVCSALTVLLTFLTTVILARQLLSPEGMSRRVRALLCEGAGVVAALALCWSDTFWFSAVEAEVYAFSSLTTALLFWLTLVWSRRVSRPHSDRYLIAIAYLLGLSIGVHELNLLCLPALLLIVAFSLRGELKRGSIALFMAGSIVAIALVLYGLIPGFLSLASRMEYFCANSLGWDYNLGALAWWVIVMLLLIAAVATLNAGGGRRSNLISVAVSCVAVGCSGLFFFSGKLIVGVSLTLAVGVLLGVRAWRGRLNIRRLRISIWCLAMVLLGFSSYALMIVRADARPPLNTGAPADIFAFQRYFAREQYGKTPLVYGPAFTAQPLRMRSWSKNADGTPRPNFNLFRIINPRPHIVRTIPGMKAKPRNAFATRQDSMQNAAALADSAGYMLTSYDYDLAYQPEMCMWFPRMTSRSAYDVNGYTGWSGADSSTMEVMENVTLAVDSAGNRVEWADAPRQRLLRPTYVQNLRFFLVYQFGYMYWRYFMWNFVGRQNDFTGRGEPDCGNFITGFTPIDEAMLDNVHSAPGEIASANKGRNVYYFLPLLLGILGIVAQCRSGVAGRRQALVLLVLFIVTGVAIVFYLNQGPAQARDRDYSFAGSFYAWCMWMGLGVIGLWRLLRSLAAKHPKGAVAGALLLAVCVPVQMLSQTWDDHDRSGRTAARDLADNQLASLKPRAIIFAAEDNYLFPLLYMQQVERRRPDVRMISMPYLVTDWYSSQLRLPLRDGSRLELTGPEGLLASSYLTNVSLGNDMEWTEALPALRKLYADAERHDGSGFVLLPTPRLFIDMQGDTLKIDLTKAGGGRSSFLRVDQLIALDLIATNAASRNPRPIYIVTSVANSLLGGQLQPYLSQVGTVSELRPGHPGLDASDVARLALHKWRYGGAGSQPTPYFDPVAAHNLSVQRRVVIQAALKLAADTLKAPYAVQLLELVEKEMPAAAAPYEAILKQGGASEYTTEGLMLADAWEQAASTLNRTERHKRAVSARMQELMRLRAYREWAETLRPTYRRYISFRVQHLIDALEAAVDSISPGVEK